MRRPSGDEVDDAMLREALVVMDVSRTDDDACVQFGSEVFEIVSESHFVWPWIVTDVDPGNAFHQRSRAMFASLIADRGKDIS